SSLICPPPLSTLFPYTTLFRSEADDSHPRRHPSVEYAGDMEEGVVPEIGPDFVRALVRHRSHRMGMTRWQWSGGRRSYRFRCFRDRKSTRLNSSHLVISYAVFC